MNLDLDSTESWVDWIENIKADPVTETISTTTSTSSSSNMVRTTSANNNWLSPYPNWEDEQVKKDIKQVLEHIDYIQLPSNLDLRNETVQSAVADWYEALELLKLKHQQLVMLSKLSQDHD